MGPALPGAAAPVWDSRQWGCKLALAARGHFEGAGRETPARPREPPLPLVECVGTALAAPTCSHSKQTFLRSRHDPVPYATPRPQAAASRSSEGSSPDPPKPPTWPGPERNPAPPALPRRVFREKDWGYQLRNRNLWGERQKAAYLLPSATSALNFANDTAAALPLPPRRAPGSLGFSNVVPGEGAPQGRRKPRAPGVLTAITGSLQGRQLLVGHPARLWGPARGAPPAAPLAGQARRLRAPPGRSCPASRCPPSVAPRWAARSLAAPRSPLVAAAARSHPSKSELSSLAPSRPPPRPGQVSFLLQPGPVILRRGSARRVAATPTASGAQRPGRLSPPLYPPGRRKGLNGAPGPGSPAAGARAPLAAWGLRPPRLNFHFWRVLRVEVNPRGEEQAKPQKIQAAPVARGVAQLQKNKQRGSLPSGEIARCFFFFPPLSLFSFFLCFLSKVASATLCLHNAGFAFRDQKLRGCACVLGERDKHYPSNPSKRERESSSAPLWRAPLPRHARGVRNRRPAQVGSTPQKPFPATLERKLSCSRLF